MRVPTETARVAVGARAVYDAVAAAYDSQFNDELDDKPLDRALLTGFAELAGSGTIADVGCGPGQATRYLARQDARVVGVDLSPRMVERARRHAPELPFLVGSMLQLPLADAALTGLVALYSVIHLTPPEQGVAYRDFARVLRPGGWLLLAFHIDSPDHTAGQINHAREWFGHRVEIDGYFLPPDTVTRQLQDAQLKVAAHLQRQPAGAEYPSRRCYLLAQRPL